MFQKATGHQSAWFIPTASERCQLRVKVDNDSLTSCGLLGANNRISNNDDNKYIIHTGNNLLMCFNSQPPPPP